MRPDSWLQIRAPREATGEGMRRRAVARALCAFQGRRDTLYRVRGVNEPLEIGQAPQAAFTCRDMDAIDLYGRARRAPGGGDRVGRRERAGWATRPRETLGRIGEGPRSDHVEILSPCVRCMDKRASRRHNSLQTEQGAFGAGTGIIIGRNRERNRERVRFRHNCPNPPFGRETHVDGAWQDPDAFGRAARDLFPRNNTLGSRINWHVAESPPWAESG